MKNRYIFLILCILLSVFSYSENRKDDAMQIQERKILTEKFEDKNTGCKITYEYYKTPDGKKILHGKYKRQWSLPKGDRNSWSGNEVITATFVEGRINGIVTINCEKQKWKRKNEFVKGKGRQISIVPVESYNARNLKLEVKNDTLVGNSTFELGNYKYEFQGKINEANEMVGRYILYTKNTSLETSNPRDIKNDWVIYEQYLCDPEYTYQDAVPLVKEIVLGYPGTTRGEQIRIKIPRLRLSITHQ